MHPRFRGRLVLFLLSIAVFFGLLWTVSVPVFNFGKARLCSCDKCLRDGDSCFAELIDASPPPFLSRTNRTSEKIFDWWKRIQGSKHNFTVYNTMVDNLFEMFPHRPHVVGPHPDRCRSCAVVGNSGNLKGSHYGPLIDHHDIVIRINRGRTKGFEADVGIKTTHHVMYPESATYLDNTTTLLFFPFKTQDFPWLFKKMSPVTNQRVLANKDKMMILNPTFIKYVHEEWLGNKGAYPSTGFLTLVLSMQMCDEVDVFGFGADKNGNWNHYFEILRNLNIRTGGHPGSYEYKVIEKFHKRNKLRFFKGY